MLQEDTGNATDLFSVSTTSRRLRSIMSCRMPTGGTGIRRLKPTTGHLPGSRSSPGYPLRVISRDGMLSARTESSESGPRARRHRASASFRGLREAERQARLDVSVGRNLVSSRSRRLVTRTLESRLDVTSLMHACRLYIYQRHTSDHAVPVTKSSYPAVHRNMSANEIEPHHPEASMATTPSDSKVNLEQDRKRAEMAHLEKQVLNRDTQFVVGQASCRVAINTSG